MALKSDCQGLYSAPLYPDAVKWSEDNQLAVGVGQAVAILNPCDLSGPRMFTTKDPPTSGTLHLYVHCTNQPGRMGHHRWCWTTPHSSCRAFLQGHRTWERGPWTTCSTR